MIDGVAFTWVAPEGLLRRGDLVRAVDAFARGLLGRNGELVGGAAPRMVALNRAILDRSLASPGSERKCGDLHRGLAGDIRELEAMGIAVLVGRGNTLLAHRAARLVLLEYPEGPEALVAVVRLTEAVHAAVHHGEHHHGENHGHRHGELHPAAAPPPEGENR